MSFARAGSLKGTRADQAGAGARALRPAKALRATAGDRSHGDVPNRALRCRNWQRARTELHRRLRDTAGTPGFD